MNYGSNSHAATWFTQEIFPRIRKSRPDARFVIAGRNPPEEVRGLAREGEIIVTGFVEDMRPLLASATVYVCPLCNGSGMKNKMLEAMAMGKAIVTTPEGISGINATHGTHLIVARTPEEFANATVSLCNNPQRREELGFAARVFVEQNYSWEHTGHLVHELYLHVMKTHTCNVTDN
jgi:glycosyltransferase involved in cell wall biosynthesis